MYWGQVIKIEIVSSKSDLELDHLMLEEVKQALSGV